MRLKKLLLLPLLFFIFSCARPTDNEPDPQPDEKPPLNITSSGDFTCARVQQKIKCWGKNEGRLGIGNIPDKGGTQTNMDDIPYVKLGDGFKAVDVKSGKHHTCALSAAGNIKCWGVTNNGYLGKEDLTVIGANEDQMTTLSKIELGDEFTVTKLFEGGNCAQIQSGDVKCWGHNDNGQLGIGNTHNRGHGTNSLNRMGNDLPVIDLGQTFDIQQIITTAYNGCALNQVGNMKCWGDMTYGILGNGASSKIGIHDNQMGNHLKIINLGSGFTVSNFDLIHLHVCALSTAGKVKCWGHNDDGQLGQDTTSTLGKVEGELSNLEEIKLGFTAKQIKVGFYHTCALSTEGRIKCWGDNSHGQLGYEDTKKRGKGLPNYTMDKLDYVDLGMNFIANSIELGIHHSCAITAKYEVKCWGQNSYKQILAQGTDSNVGDADDEMGDNLKTMKIFHDIADLSLL